jgi:hypothetical protein
MWAGHWVCLWCMSPAAAQRVLCLSTLCWVHTSLTSSSSDAVPLPLVCRQLELWLEKSLQEVDLLVSAQAQEEADRSCIMPGSPASRFETAAGAAAGGVRQEAGTVITPSSARLSRMGGSAARVDRSLFSSASSPISACQRPVASAQACVTPQAMHAGAQRALSAARGSRCGANGSGGKAATATASKALALWYAFALGVQQQAHTDSSQSSVAHAGSRLNGGAENGLAERPRASRWCA